MISIPDRLTRDDLVRLLALDQEADLAALFERAYEMKLAQVGRKVYYRGIVEFSNVCTKDCYYCGIRRHNTEVERFTMTDDEVMECINAAHLYRYGSVVLQSGERMDEDFVRRVETLVKRIKQIGDGELGITLSLGEQSAETLERWFDAGAHRYLLRIESSNPAIYQSLHPEDHDFDSRLRCIEDLRRIGYQVGTGVMIGLPGQTLEDLANDILFFQEHDIDMIGMGPYIVHHNTPLAEKMPDFDPARQLRLGLIMIALTRLTLKDVNIAATTALQALDPKGREMGLQAGANIIMPNITHTKYRTGYQLYDNKPCLDENAGMCRFCLDKRIDSIGEEVGYNEWGDSPHFLKKQKS